MSLTFTNPHPKCSPPSPAAPRVHGRLVPKQLQSAGVKKKFWHIASMTCLWSSKHFINCYFSIKTISFSNNLSTQKIQWAICNIEMKVPESSSQLIDNNNGREWILGVIQHMAKTILSGTCDSLKILLYMSIPFSLINSNSQINLTK